MSDPMNDRWTRYCDSLWKDVSRRVSTNIRDRFSYNDLGEVMQAVIESLADNKAGALGTYSPDCDYCRRLEIMQWSLSKSLEEIKKKAGAMLFDELHGGSPTPTFEYNQEISRMEGVTEALAKLRDDKAGHVCPGAQQLQLSDPYDYDPPF